MDQLGTSSVAVISSCSHAVRRFQRLTSTKSMSAQHFSVVQKDNPLVLEAVMEFLRGEAVSLCISVVADDKCSGFQK